MDDVAVAEVDAGAEARAADECAVGALEVFDRGRPAANHDPRVTPRDTADVDPDATPRVAPESGHARRQDHSLVANDQPETGVGDRPGRFFRILYIGNE